jgi:hypothetical protein
MKASLWITLGFIFIFLLSTCYAACEDPLIAYDACLAACPKAVERPLAHSECSNTCIGKYQSDSRAYSRCQEEEREKKEQQEQEAEQRKIDEALSEKSKAEIEAVTGTVMVTHKDGTVDRITQQNSAPSAKPGDRISTDPGSSVTLKLKEGATVRLGPGTVFDYVDVMEDIWTGKNIYYIDEGEALFERPPGYYFMFPEIETPHATATERQTKFIVEVDRERDMTAFYLYEGILDVNTTKGESSLLNTGEMMTVDSLGNAAISNLSMEDWDGLVNSISTGAEFTPSWKKAEPAGAEQAVPEADETGMIMYIVLAGAVFVIIIAAVFIARRERR